ncbi:ABC transporter permease [Sediminicoccus sp. KRV36]|uniref:ABC transporter permease n=1 Tax=Sediminicoccus sp. KRV36 TaxID=3133721 RepID=UPI00200F60DC|nr:ABC transporter permease [Sediminicoccus rosea]UPY38766.1 ABC transporter permease [Sediminicoccus rosea]
MNPERGRAGDLILGFLAIGLAVGVWEVSVHLFRVSPTLLAPPTAVWAAMMEHPAILLEQARSTAWETALGFLLASLFGVVGGALLSASATLRAIVMPWVLALQIVPKMALAPLFVVWLGVGAPCRLAFAIFIGFFPVLVGTLSGLRSADSGALRLCASLGATRWQTGWRVRLPYAIPQILAGMKTAATMALLGIVIGEFVTAQQGLGYIVMFASSLGEVGLVMAALLMLCAIGAVLYGAVMVLEAGFARWYAAPITVGAFG